MMFSEIESRITFLASISRDRALKFILPFRNQFQGEQTAACHANTKCTGLSWLSEKAISFRIINHSDNG